MKPVTASVDNPMGYFGFIPNTEITVSLVNDCKVGDIVRFLLSSKSIYTAYSALLPAREIALQRYPYLPFTSMIRIDRTAAERWWERAITAVYLDGTCKPDFIKKQLKHFPALRDLQIAPDCMQRTPEEIGELIALRKRDASSRDWLNVHGIGVLASELRICTTAYEVGTLISYDNFRMLDSCSQLHTVDLSGCMVTDYGVGSLVRRCRNLKSLRLAGCNKITFDVFSMLCTNVQMNSSLKILDLSDCTGIVRQQSLLINFPVLATLNLSGCNRMNIWTVRTIVQVSPQLTNIDLTGIPGIGLSEAQSLVGKFPQLVNVAYGSRSTPLPSYPFTRQSDGLPLEACHRHEQDSDDPLSSLTSDVLNILWSGSIGDLETGVSNGSPAKSPIPDTSADSQVRKRFFSYDLRTRQACITLVIHMYGRNFIDDEELEDDLTPLNEIRDEDIQNVWNNLDKSIVLEAIGTFLPDEKGRYTNRGV